MASAADLNAPIVQHAALAVQSAEWTIARRESRKRIGLRGRRDGPRRPGMPVRRMDWRSQGWLGQDRLSMGCCGRVAQ